MLCTLEFKVTAVKQYKGMTEFFFFLLLFFARGPFGWPNFFEDNLSDLLIERSPCVFEHVLLKNDFLL